MEISHVILLTQVRGVGVGGGGLEVYNVSFPWILKLVDCLVEGLPAKEKTLGRIR